MSFGADGDTRELKGMRITSSLLLKRTHPLASLSPSYKQQPLQLPKMWSAWFAARNPSQISCVQDTVHIYSCQRLLKPSVVLPLGTFVAASHHLHLLKINIVKVNMH